MPVRMLRDGILDSERVNSVSPMAELHYRKLFSLADDYGRFESSPKLLKVRAWGWRPEVTETEIESWNSELAAATNSSGDPLILLYEVEGKMYLELQDFGQRIRTDRKTGQAAPSRYPDPPCAAKRGDVRRSAAHSGAAPSSAASKQGVVVSSSEIVNSSSESGSGAKAAPPPPTPALTAAEWNKPDADEVAQRTASDLIPRHWFPSDERLSIVNLRLELATAADPDAHGAAIRLSHERWRDQVNQARLSSSLPRAIANKAFEWWIKDRMYLQEPRFGSTRLEQAATSTKPGVSRTVARLLADGKGKNG